VLLDNSKNKYSCYRVDEAVGCKRAVVYVEY